MLYLFFAVTLIALMGLATMILMIARALADCPENAASARAAGITIATGFLSIGAGGVLLIATLPALAPGDDGMLIFAMGLACIMLGLGFTQAVTTLRAVVEPAARLVNEAVPQEQVMSMKPVLG